MIGYMTHPDGSGVPISYIDLKLAEVGEDYRIGPPNQYSFTFIAGRQMVNKLSLIKFQLQFIRVRSWCNISDYFS